MRAAAVTLVAVVLTLFVALLLNGSYGFEGPVVLPVTYSHGLHAGDVLILLAWAVAVVALAVAVRRPRP